MYGSLVCRYMLQCPLTAAGEPVDLDIAGTVSLYATNKIQIHNKPNLFSCNFYFYIDQQTAFDKYTIFETRSVLSNFFDKLQKVFQKKKKYYCSALNQKN